MSRVLFVTNGHGEIAIADRIAAELRAVTPEIEIEHLALVGDVPCRNAIEVGPRKRMPSGGLVAMGNLPNILRDLRAGLARLTLGQWRSLRSARGRYAVVVATGDVFALWMALQAKSPTVYVGTAKSVLVARYGAAERRLLRRARALFVRDESTAADLRSFSLAAQAPGNVIADLFTSGDMPAFDRACEGFEPIVAILPGSRERAYADAVRLVEIFARAAATRPTLGAVLSIAPGIDAMRMADEMSAHGRVERSFLAEIPFELRDGERVLLRAWSGEIGPLLRRSAIVLGQAGTANEAAAAAGLPVLVMERESRSEHDWYRRRQAKLLGEALIVLPLGAGDAATLLGTLVDDREERARRGAAGRARMGEPGGARRIAAEIARIAHEAAA